MRGFYSRYYEVFHKRSGLFEALTYFGNMFYETALDRRVQVDFLFE